MQTNKCTSAKKKGLREIVCFFLKVKLELDGQVEQLEKIRQETKNKLNRQGYASLLVYRSKKQNKTKRKKSYHTSYTLSCPLPYLKYYKVKT